MRRLLFVAAFVLVLPGAAQAKGPFQVCGASGCKALSPETQLPVRLGIEAGTQALTGVAPASYFTIGFADFGAFAYWVPSAGVLRIVPQNDTPVWVTPLESELALLVEKTSGMRPYAAPRHAVAWVDYERVRNGDGYLRLLTAGTPALAPVGMKWVSVRITGGVSPWNNGSVSLWVSRSGYLKRDGQVLRIAPALAKRTLARLPLG
jgi:hypothetical protein